MKVTWNNSLGKLVYLGLLELEVQSLLELEAQTVKIIFSYTCR